MISFCRVSAHYVAPNSRMQLMRRGHSSVFAAADDASVTVGDIEDIVRG